MSAGQRVSRAILALGLVAGTLAAADEIRRVGVLYAGSAAQRAAAEGSLLETLRGKGYVEGRNLIVVRRYAEGDSRKLATYARELESMRPEVVVTMCTPSTRAMSTASASIPIVMGMVSDPVGQKLVASLPRPGRNVTGTANQYDEMLPKMLEVLASVVPRGARLAVLASQANVAHQRLWPIAEEAATPLHVRIRRYEVGDPAGLPGVLESMQADRPQAIFILPDDPMLTSRSAIIIGFAQRHRMATLSSAREFAEAGGLMAYGTSFAQGYREVASYVDRVLRGERTQSLPVALPTQIELTLNLKSARAIGLAIPDSVRVRADRVIE